MWITRILFSAPKVPGLQWAGKYRRPITISNSTKRRTRKRILLIENNVTMLSKPYITQAQELNSAKERKLTGKQWPYKKRVYASEKFNSAGPNQDQTKAFLNHLNVSKM